MSGGSMNYLYVQVQDASFSRHTPMRQAFHKHLMLVAQALKAIEWVDSADSASGSEDKAIMACISPTAVLEQATENAINAIAELNAALAQAHTKETP